MQDKRISLAYYITEMTNLLTSTIIALLELYRYYSQE